MNSLWLRSGFTGFMIGERCSFALSLRGPRLIHPAGGTHPRNLELLDVLSMDPQSVAQVLVERPDLEHCERRVGVPFGGKGANEPQVDPGEDNETSNQPMCGA